MISCWMVRNKLNGLGCLRVPLSAFKCQAKGGNLKRLMEYMTDSEKSELKQAKRRYNEAIRSGNSKQIMVAESQFTDVMARLFDTLSMRVGVV